MKDYVKDFDEKLQDESFSDDTLLSIARDYIRELQDMIEVPTTAIINDLNIHSRLFVFDGCHKIYLVDNDDVDDVKKRIGAMIHRFIQLKDFRTYFGILAH